MLNTVTQCAHSHTHAHFTPFFPAEETMVPRELLPEASHVHCLFIYQVLAEPLSQARLAVRSRETVGNQTGNAHALTHRCPADWLRNTTKGDNQLEDAPRGVIVTVYTALLG